MTDYDVIICGLGPVGQLLALLLGDRGVRTLAFDREPRALPAAARGGHRRRGPADLPVGRARRGGARRRAGPAGREHHHGRRAAGRGRPHPHGPARPPAAGLDQPAGDGAHDARRARAPAERRRAPRADARGRSTGAPTTSTSSCGRPTAGARERISARWLVGCDGAASAVRARLEIPFEGRTTPQRWVVVDALVDRPLRKVPHPHFVGDAARPMVTLPMSPGRHRWEWMLHPGEDAAPLLEPDRASGARSRVARRRDSRDRARGRLHVPHAHGRPLAPRPRAAGGRRGAPDAAVRRPGVLVRRARRREPGVEARRRPRAAPATRCSTPTSASAARTSPRCSGWPNADGRPRPGDRARARSASATRPARDRRHPAAAAGRRARQAAADLRRRRVRHAPARLAVRRTVGSLFPADRPPRRSARQRLGAVSSDGHRARCCGRRASGHRSRRRRRLARATRPDLGAAAPGPLRVRLRRGPTTSRARLRAPGGGIAPPARIRGGAHDRGPRSHAAASAGTSPRAWPSGTSSSGRSCAAPIPRPSSADVPPTCSPATLATAFDGVERSASAHPARSRPGHDASAPRSRPPSRSESADREDLRWHAPRSAPTAPHPPPSPTGTASSGSTLAASSCGSCGRPSDAEPAGACPTVQERRHRGADLDMAPIAMVDARDVADCATPRCSDARPTVRAWHLTGPLPSSPSRIAVLARGTSRYR